MSDVAPARDLVGRRVLVTGGSTGIGAAVVDRLARAGAHVVAVARRYEPLDELVGRVPGAVGITADLADPDHLDSVVDRTVEVLGGLDVVVNNAARADWLPALEVGRDLFDEIVGLNLWTPLRLAQLAHPHLAAREDGCVVMIGSVDARRPSAGAAVYGATKAGLAAMTVVLAKEWAGDGIRVMQVDPGLVDTPLASDSVDEIVASRARVNVVDRPGRPEEVAGLVHYLVSPLGRFATGTTFTLDGGALAMGPFDVRHGDR